MIQSATSKEEKVQLYLIISDSPKVDCDCVLFSRVDAQHALIPFGAHCQANLLHIKISHACSKASPVVARIMSSALSIARRCVSVRLAVASAVICACVFVPA